MLDNFRYKFRENSVVAVACSGGADSMALLHFLFFNAKKLNITVRAVNVEHGIRGKQSLSDTEFVKDFCKKNGITLYTYSVDSPSYAKKNRLSLEQSARNLRYDCFADCISKNNCDYIATAHHLSDNAETILFNLFRGTGIKGVTGINDGLGGKIIRPFINVTKQEIDEYVSKNGVPFVTDETNLTDDYTRNFIRHNILPKIKEIFPNAEQSLYRFSLLAKNDEEYLDGISKSVVIKIKNGVQIKLPLEKAIFSRAVILALKEMGVKKDWEKVHIDDVIALSCNENGAMVNLPGRIVAIKEYDRITFRYDKGTQKLNRPFTLSDFSFGGKKFYIKRQNADIDVKTLKSGLYCDLDKIPEGAVIRTKKTGDRFTKFGGGTKSLSDYFTDKKIPLYMRGKIPLIAAGSEILCIFGVAISDKVKIDGTTVNVIKISTEGQTDGQL